MGVPFQKFHSYLTRLVSGEFTGIFITNVDTLQIYLSNTEPNIATMSVKTDLPEIVNQNGYDAPIDIQNTLAPIPGSLPISGVDVTITATGGPIGPFRYTVLYDASLPTLPLIGFWDYGSSITLQDSEKYTVGFGTTVLTVQ